MLEQPPSSDVPAQPVAGGELRHPVAADGDLLRAALEVPAPSPAAMPAAARRTQEALATSTPATG